MDATSQFWVTRLGLCLAVGVALFGCGELQGRPLTHWTLGLPGEASRDVELPAHLELPDRPLAYHLDTLLQLTEDERGHALEIAVVGWRTQLELEVDGRNLAPLERPPPAA